MARSVQLDEGTYASAQEHLTALLDWLRDLLMWQVAVTRQTYGSLADDEYRGLYIPDAEVAILGEAGAELPAALVERRHALAAERQAIARRAHAAVRQGVDLPLLRVARLFRLSPFEVDVLLLALAVEVDLRYERLYAFIQDDVTRKRPSVDLALRLFCVEPEAYRQARAAFLPDAALLQQRLVQLFEDGQRHTPLLARFIKLDERIVTELVGQPIANGSRPVCIDPPLLPFVALSRPQRALESLVLPADLAARLRQIIAPHRRMTPGDTAPTALILALQGSYGSGRRAIAEALCAEAQLPLLTVDLDRLLQQDALTPTGAVLDPLEAGRRIVREAALQNAALLWLGTDRLLHDENYGAWRHALLRTLDEHRGLAFLALDRAWEARGLLRHGTFLRIELPALSYTEREDLWRMRLNGDRPDDATLRALASTFRLSGGQIRDAAAMARALAHWDGGKPPDPQALYAACRAQSSGKLDALAHKIASSYGWDDIVLPPDQVAQLREICLQVRHRRTVLESWGFDRHLAMGKGVNVLFAGQSGTGKTMAAEIIASDLGLELYKVDLSTMVSKYIGETEKNLDRVFRAAREANAILFFDEADALFGKRSEVKDAHDRYANIEVGYLLQKMEEYDGVVILATNLRKNLDDAFVRRLHVAIDFPFPEEPDRLAIWRKVFPPEAPLAAEVDLAFIARQFKLAGGNIRNIALLAAYLAAEEGTTITMAHVIRAIRREYQKLGKLVTAAEFGEYLAAVRPETL